MEQQKRTFTLRGYQLNSNGEQPEDRKIELTEDEMYRIYSGYRPRNMDLEDFKIISNILKKEMKRYLKGRYIHVSKIHDTAWNEYTKDLEYKPIQKGSTYVKNKENDKA